MKPNSLSKVAIGTLLFSIGLGAGFFAQTLTDSPQRVEHKRGDLAGAPDMEVIVSTAEYKPGESIDLHLHHGAEAVYVIQGAKVQAPGKDATQIPTGVSLLNQRDVKHAGFTIVGDASLKLFTVHVVDKGKPLYEYAR
ncbi:MAG: cupin domain-containing protein [Rhizobacter sp.]|jgi:quercetin dioxygenase-like cupin family protein|nr:cupin domain-containing protein [Rhizobacter sp.]MBP6269637.1 cupin domain-containing protein [Rhizobacter sp.]